VGSSGRTRRPRRKPLSTASPSEETRGLQHVADDGPPWFASPPSGTSWWPAPPRRHAAAAPNCLGHARDAGRIVRRSRWQRRTRATANKPATSPWFLGRRLSRRQISGSGGRSGAALGNGWNWRRMGGGYG
jgi:hypothetical protein